MTTDPFDLTGRTAVVTGCRRGIGFAIAVAMARAGADIIGISATLEGGESAIRSAVEAENRSFAGHRADFADPEAVADLAATLAGGLAPIDILVNAAGTTARFASAVHPIDEWDRVVQVNLSSQFVLTQALAAPMIERGRGKVIFIASMLSFQGGVGVAAYAASKSGIAGLTRALANEWAALGVNVNAIAPGYIATDLTQRLKDDDVRNAEILARIPARRWGEPSEVGGAAVFLASAASDYVHGTILPVDGGWLSR